MKTTVYVYKNPARILNWITDDNLPDDVIEFRHPKTNKLITRIVNIKGEYNK